MVPTVNVTLRSSYRSLKEYVFFFKGGEKSSGPPQNSIPVVTGGQARGSEPFSLDQKGIEGNPESLQKVIRTQGSFLLSAHLRHIARLQ